MRFSIRIGRRFFIGGAATAAIGAVAATDARPAHAAGAIKPDPFLEPDPFFENVSRPSLENLRKAMGPETYRASDFGV